MTEQRRPRDPSIRRQWAVLNEHVLWWAPLALIIAFIMLSYPTFARIREQGRQQSCAANLESIAASTLRYARDHDGRLPDGTDWDRQLEGYILNRRVLRCPSDRTDAPTSYGMNPALYGASDQDIEQPALTVLYHDGRDGVVVQRHNGGANYVFADGHCQWLRYPPDGVLVSVEER